MASVVVCDDDSVLRGTISDLCEAAGLRVVAETDRGSDAIELVRRFGVDILVLDLSLQDGSGERALEQLREVTPHPIIVVFTAYADNAAPLIAMGAREVIEKPDLERLAAVLEVLASAGAADAADDAEERRRTSRPVAPPPELWRSPSGVCSAGDLRHTLREVEEGDAVLVVAVLGLANLEQDAGATLAADCRLHVARLLRETLRTQDVLHDQPDVDGFTALLRGGDGRAAAAVWQRVVALAAAAGVPGELVAATARVDREGPRDAVHRAVAAVRAAGPGVRSLLSA
jgi:CheY-like chemotaxis protein